jgi:glutamine amidotransferase
MVYRGSTLSMADLLSRPAHSILVQSFSSKERTSSYLTPPTLNGDGFGIGWYNDAVSDDRTPGVFRSIQPAWSSVNLRQLSQKIHSGLFFAHVRAASAPPLSETNCHPFEHGRFMFMHNGMLGDFRLVKRALEELLEDDFYGMLQGNTDSELLFALFLNQLKRTAPGFDPATSEVSHEDMLAAFRTMLLDIEEVYQRCVCEREGRCSEVSLLNLAVTDGKTVIATRVALVATPPDAEPKDPSSLPHASLYFASGNAFRDGDRIERVGRREGMVIIASEPITTNKKDWVVVNPGHAVVITGDKEVLVVKL